MIEINAKALDAATKALGKYADKLPNCISMSINKSIRSGRTEMWNLVKGEFRIKQGDFYAAVAPMIRFASPGSLGGTIGAQWAGMIPTWDFHIAPRSITNPRIERGEGSRRGRRRRRRKPITAAVKTGGGASIPGGFVAQMASGHIGAFRRSTPSRNPIHEMHSISAPFMISPPPTKDAIERKIEEIFNEEFERQVARFAGK